MEIGARSDLFTAELVLVKTCLLIMRSNFWMREKTVKKQEEREQWNEKTVLFFFFEGWSGTAKIVQPIPSLQSSVA